MTRSTLLSWMMIPILLTFAHPRSRLHHHRRRHLLPSHHLMNPPLSAWPLPSYVFHTVISRRPRKPTSPSHSPPPSPVISPALSTLPSLDSPRNNRYQVFLEEIDEDAEERTLIMDDDSCLIDLRSPAQLSSSSPPSTPPALSPPNESSSLSMAVAIIRGQKKAVESQTAAPASILSPTQRPPTPSASDLYHMNAINGMDACRQHYYFTE
jgi:hypothetical protein